MEAHTSIDHRVEMFQKGGQTDSFFNMKALAPRPMSTATVFDIDYEDDDNSEIEDDSPISPRFSLNSVSSPRHLPHMAANSGQDGTKE